MMFEMLVKFLTDSLALIEELLSFSLVLDDFLLQSQDSQLML